MEKGKGREVEGKELAQEVKNGVSLGGIRYSG